MQLMLPKETPLLRRFYLECHRELIDPKSVIETVCFLERNPHWLEPLGLRRLRGRDISGE
jgi:hypothetical protein